MRLLLVTDAYSEPRDTQIRGPAVRVDSDERRLKSEDKYGTAIPGHRHRSPSAYTTDGRPARVTREPTLPSVQRADVHQADVPSVPQDTR